MPLIPGPLYRALFRPILFSLDAETAHHLILTMLSMMPPLPCEDDAPELRCSIWGVDFSNPVGLAAGMDKDAVAIGAWNSLGFGFAELGTITPRPQPGNPKPRVFRLPEYRALINRLGFPSEGMEAVAPRIEKIRRTRVQPRVRIALNFGPNKDTPVEKVAADYASLMARMGPLADFVVINVSSPNTPGLRNWQSPEKMRQLFGAMKPSESHRVPILIKIAPDLDDATVAAICDTAMELHLDGIVVSNTTLKRDEVKVISNYEGGLSGEPLAALARKLIANVHRQTQARLPIIGVGGITNADDGYAHIKAGASLVELYTGLIYEGPGVVATIKAGLVNLLRRDGFRSISEAVGTDVRG